MEGAGPHQAATGPQQVDANLHQVESRGSQHSDPFVNLEWRGDHERSVRTTHTSKSQSRGKSRVCHAKNNRDMQHEIDELKRELRHAQWKRLSPNSELSSEEADDASYRQRFRTLPSKSFSCDEKYHRRHRYKSPPCKGLGNDAMNKASLPRRFHQPTFTIYNGRTDPVEHVSHFN